MIKTKKITIKPFLNKKLAPEASDSDGKVMYPLYLQITYDRMNTQIRSYYGRDYSDLNDPRLMNLKEFESNTFKKIIRHETKNTTLPYDLKGLKNKYEVYSISIHIAMDEYLKKKLHFANKKTNNELMFVLDYKGFKCTFNNLYTASRKLFENHDKYISPDFKYEITVFNLFNKLVPESNRTYDFPTLIDWRDGSFKAVFETKLTKELKDKKRVAEMVKVIDSIVNERLKNIVKED